MMVPYVVIEKSSKIFMLNPFVIMNPKHPIQTLGHRVNNHPKDLDHDQDDRTRVVGKNDLLLASAICLRNDLCHD